MGLEKYWQKRNFERTPEPHGEVAANAGGELAFVIQKHAASHLHYDFRLEIGGTLKSWAIPKGPSLDPSEKRLAVEVEDHPLAYGDFEGIIPEGEYGGGTVMLWDRGSWEPEGDPEEGYKKGRLRFRLHGEKLHGSWSLVRMGAHDTDKRHNWLLIKSHDEAARPDDELEITERRSESVLTGRQMPEIAAAADRVHSAKKKTGNAGRSASLARTPGAVTHQRGRSTPTAPEVPVAVQADTDSTQPGEAAHRDARALHAEKPQWRGKAGLPAGEDGRAEPISSLPNASLPKSRRQRDKALPEFIAPQLATLVAMPPAEGEWLAEMKFDGYRLLARIEDGAATLWTRNEQDWSARFAAIAGELAQLPVQNAWLDGEVIAVGRDGRSSFSLLQQAFGKAKRQGEEAAQLLYCLFDLLYLNGHDLRGEPQARRKQLLEELLQDRQQGSLRYSDHVSGHIEEAQRHACLHGEEGIMLKRADAPYVGDRSRHWLKLKCGNRQEFVIGGYTDPEGSREEFGALLVGYHAPGRGFVYAGRVGTGFDKDRLAELGKKLRKLSRKSSPFDAAPSRAESRGAHWVKPELIAEVRFAGWTHLERLRQAAFLGLRDDKPAAAIGLEQAQPAPGRKNSSRAKPSRTKAAAGKAQAVAPAAGNTAAARASGAGTVAVAGVAISHPGRVLFPDSGISKLDIARYYERVADWLLPQIEARPLTLLRCPQGLKSCFFQRNLSEGLPPSLHPVDVKTEARDAVYMTADSLTAVIDLVQLGVLELHTWGARRDRLDRPDRVIFDLDPAPDIAWKDFVVYARLVRALLEELELPAFLKTTGGKGVHIEIPLERAHGWEEVKGFASAVAHMLAEQLPEHFIARASKGERRGRVFVDYLRNAESATAVAAYSTRARPGAPVALPISWEELADTPPGHFTIRNVPARLEHLRRSPWQDYEASRVRLSRRLLTRLGVGH